MTAPRSGRSHWQAGITLLEVLISLSIIAMATVGLNMLSDRFSEDTREMVTAGQLRTFGEAAKAYVKDNYAAVQATATPTVPYLVSAGMLVGSGRLPLGYQPKNAHEQSICALVLEPTPGQLQALVVTEGGKAIGDPSLGTIAATVGGSGGAVYATNAANVVGASGAWTLPVANFDNLVNQLSQHCDGTAGNVRLQAGHSAMALWFENGDASAAFVARDAVPGRPELNAMNTPLVMNSIQTAGAVCTAGGIARDASGGLLTCRSGAWTAPSSSSSCEATTSDLNNLQTDGRCYNGANLPNSPAGTEWVFVEVFRHVDTSAYYVSQRVIGTTGAAVGKIWTRNQTSATQAGGWTAWVQMADPGVSIANGNVTANGQISVGANNRLLGNGSQGSYGATTVAGNKNGWTGLEFRDASGNYQINQMTNRSNIGYYDVTTGRWLNYSDTAGNLTLDQTGDYGSGRLNPGWAVETWGCSTGQIAKAAYTVRNGWAWTGELLSCRSGVWSSSGKAPTYLSRYGFPGGVVGDWDAGWHQFCAIEQYNAAQQTVAAMRPDAGPNVLGQYHYVIHIENQVTWGTVGVCWDYQ